MSVEDNTFDTNPTRISNRRFIVELVSAFPQFLPLLQEHTADHDEVLPHLFMGDLTRYAIDTYVHRTEREEAEKLPQLFEFLESHFVNDDDATRELLTDSFIENLSYPGERYPDWEPEAEGVRDLLGPIMRAKMERYLG